MEHAHISASFDAELRALKEQVLSMGSLVEANIAAASQALGDRDPNLARKVIERDRDVNRHELAIDEACVSLLARRQPAASDLRFIAATLKMVVDLERMGDLAANMAERVLALCEEPPLDEDVNLATMSEITQRMLHDALDAFVDGDVARAERVLATDDEVDQMLRLAFGVLRSTMQRDPKAVNRALSMLFFAKNVERLADHTTNVAEMVIYLVRGKDVRHVRQR